MLYSIGRFLLACFYKICFRFEVQGSENIPKKDSFILVSNHVSNLDPVAIGIACSRHLNYMAKEELFRNRLFGFILNKVNVFPVKRNSADLSAIREAMRRVKKKQPLVLFPEGSRQNLSGPYPGVGFLSVKFNVPVIPAFIKGTELALPKGARIIRFKKVCVRFGRRVSFDKNMPYEQITRMVMDDIRRLSA
ncbi:MAG: 1-acyl-sn-glycerol-3-phosphate acyltransferase [Candidatus Omnitrophica bacterium]|nr:1-acyl-sn-glycerol-3-phosphate acyltransferase [Candidatus Omnitrophota bacterium]